MSASLRELQRLASRKPLKILRFPPDYVVVTDQAYDALKHVQRLDEVSVVRVAVFVSEHFLEVRGFIKGYSR